MYYCSVNSKVYKEEISKTEQGFIEQIALNFLNIADEPSQWYAGLTKNLQNCLTKHRAYGAYYTSINMDEKKYASYLKQLLVKKYGFEGNTKGNVHNDSTIVYIYKKD